MPRAKASKEFRADDRAVVRVLPFKGWDSGPPDHIRPRWGLSIEAEGGAAVYFDFASSQDIAVNMAVYTASERLGQGLKTQVVVHGRDGRIKYEMTYPDETPGRSG